MKNISKARGDPSQVVRGKCRGSQQYHTSRGKEGLTASISSSKSSLTLNEPCSTSDTVDLDTDMRRVIELDTLIEKVEGYNNHA
jgi:hypothetical protein